MLSPPQVPHHFDPTRVRQGSFGFELPHPWEFSAHLLATCKFIAEDVRSFHFGSCMNEGFIERYLGKVRPFIEENERSKIFNYNSGTSVLHRSFGYDNHLRCLFRKIFHEEAESRSIAVKNILEATYVSVDIDDSDDRTVLVDKVMDLDSMITQRRRRVGYIEKLDLGRCHFLTDCVEHSVTCLTNLSDGLANNSSLRVLAGDLGVTRGLWHTEWIPPAVRASLLAEADAQCVQEGIVAAPSIAEIREKKIQKWHYAEWDQLRMRVRELSTADVVGPDDCISENGHWLPAAGSKLRFLWPDAESFLTYGNLDLCASIELYPPWKPEHRDLAFARREGVDLSVRKELPKLWNALDKLRWAILTHPHLEEIEDIDVFLSHLRCSEDIVSRIKAKLAENKRNNQVASTANSSQ